MSKGINKFALLGLGQKEVEEEQIDEEIKIENNPQKKVSNNPKVEIQKEQNIKRNAELINTKKTRNAYSLPLVLHLAVKRYTETENLRKQSDGIKGRTTQDDTVEEAITFFLNNTEKGKIALEKAKRELMP